EKLISVKELAEILRVTPRTIYRYVSKNAIPHYRSATGRIYFDLEAVMRWLEDWTTHYQPKRRRKKLVKISYEGGE
ncbi:MAG: helix-turn-helix domain-containing protein, partial [Candidatus Brockarchaeota archaeon]|nr:helix-turn-helix domain-containing protein [Candidatus Brockarchaeota archaeon]